MERGCALSDEYKGPLRGDLFLRLESITKIFKLEGRGSQEKSWGEPNRQRFIERGGSSRESSWGGGIRVVRPQAEQGIFLGGS